MERVKAANAVATQGLIPDLTVMIDIDPAVGWIVHRTRIVLKRKGLNSNGKSALDF